MIAMMLCLHTCHRPLQLRSGNLHVRVYDQDRSKLEVKSSFELLQNKSASRTERTMRISLIYAFFTRQAART